MKIKQRNIGILMFAAIFTTVYIFSLINSMISQPHYFLSLDLNGYIANAFIISLSAFLFFGALCGSYIEVTGDQLIRLEGYSKKRFLLGKIAKIYCAPHIFLGPSMFFNYKEESAIFGKEKKLLVLNQYRDKDKKALLYFLNEKFPKIQQDENCEKIRNGEKILTKR